MSLTRRLFLGECASFAAVRCVAPKGARPSAAVREELRRQIAEGLIAGGVCGLVGGPLYADGERTRHPVSTPMADDCIFDLASVGNPRAVETFTNGRLPPGVHGDESARAYPHPMGNGSAFSTAGDLLKFVGDLLVRRTFPKAYYDLLLTPCWEKGGVRRSFGWDMSATGHRPEGWSAATIAHGGYTGNTIAVDPEKGFAGVVLTNRTGDRLKGYAGHRRLLSLMSGVV